ncbi:glycosyltransferase 87 family protein [Helicobacter fennelliae]
MDSFRLIHSKTSGFFTRYPQCKWLFLVLLGLIVLRYGYLSFLQAMQSSLDMQWYPTIQFWGLGAFENNAINPYLAYFNGDTFMANNPNYMPTLYFLMFPFGLLDWEGAKASFAIFNIICFLLTFFVFWHHGISKAFLWLLSILVVVGYTFPNVIGNGQIAIFVGLCVSIAYCYRHKPLVLIVALILIGVKHSFALPIFLGFFLAGFRKEVLIACGVIFAIVCAFAFKVDSNPFEILYLMSKVNSMYYNANALGGPSDLFSLSQKIFHTPYSPIALINICIYLSFIVLVVKYKPKDSIIIASSILLSLFSLPHLGYDHYMFFVAIIIAKDALKTFDWRMIGLIGVSLFLWRGAFLKPYIDTLSQKILYTLKVPMGGGQTHWAMDMGVVFCFILCVVLIVLFYTILRDKNATH